MRLFLDMEFTGLHQKTTPISLALVSEEGHSFYAEFTDYDKGQVDVWLQENVISKLTMLPRLGENNFLIEGVSDYNIHIAGDTTLIQYHLRKFIVSQPLMEIWGDCLAYDWVLFCELFGGARSLPGNIHYIPFDLCTLLLQRGLNPDMDRADFVRAASAKTAMQKHNALADAMILMQAYQKLQIASPINVATSE